MKDFLSTIIRDEVSRVMKDLIPKTPPVLSQTVTPVLSQIPQVTQAPPKEQIGQDYLWALLGKKLLSNVEM